MPSTKILFVGKRVNHWDRWAIRDTKGVTHIIPVRRYRELGKRVQKRKELKDEQRL